MSSLLRNQENTMTLEGSRHWVEDLFPPKYGVTIEELLQKPVENDIEGCSPEDGGSSTDHKKHVQDSVFAKLARRISPLDIDAIRNVYERVWVMTQLEEEELRKRFEEEFEPDDERTLSMPRPGSKSQTFCRKQKNADTSTSDINEKAPLNVQDSCIWNSDEINILRNIFQTAKEQNVHLTARMKESENQFLSLKEKYEKKYEENEKNSEKLKHAVKANQRFTILAENLKQQVDKSDKQTITLRKHIQDLEKERRDLIEKIHELRKCADHERLDRKKVELQLQRRTQQELRERRIHEEKLKTLHEEDINFLQKTIDDLTTELTKEKSDHERTQRGLNHLRQHFTVLSFMSDETEHEVPARNDQLTTWTY